MANWTPQGFVGQMFKLVGKHVPPSPLMTPPVQWGEEATVRERFGAGVAHPETSRRMYALRHPLAPEQVLDFFTAFYGPTSRAHAARDAKGQAAMRRALVNLWPAANRARDGGTHVQAEYLDVQARRA